MGRNDGYSGLSVDVRDRREFFFIIAAIILFDVANVVAAPLEYVVPVSDKITGHCDNRATNLFIRR